MTIPIAKVIRRVRAASDALRTSFFFLPAVSIVVAFFAARLLVGVTAGDWIGRSTVDSARSVLSTTAAATITFASVTFSVSPRSCSRARASSRHG